MPLDKATAYTVFVLLRVCLLLLALIPGIFAETAASLGAAVREMTLDPDACYRVRDLSLQRDDTRIYLTDGFLIFGKPVAGRRVVAIYYAAEPSDDAEMIVRPPNRSERLSLSMATESPNLDEHFRSALLIFTDDTAEEFLKAINEGVPKPNPEMGLVIASRLDSTVRNLCTSFQVRIVLDLLAKQPSRGLFYAAITGKTLDNFDFMYDPTLPEESILGQVSSKGVLGFDVWTSFQNRKHRQGGAPSREDVLIENYRIDAKLQPDLRLDVVTRVTARPQQRLTGALAFELAPEMEVTAVKIDGQPAEIYRRESMRANLIGGRTNDPFLVILAQQLEAGSSHEIEFVHSGKVIRPAGNNVFYVAARTNWFPSHGFGFTNFDVTFRVPKDLRVVATGDIGEEKEEGEFRIVRRRTSAPVRLAGFNIGAYENAGVTRGGFEVQVYANRTVETALQARPNTIVLPPALTRSMGGRTARVSEVVTNQPGPTPNPQARLRELATEIASSLEWMSTQFGPPPLKTLTASPIPGNFGQGFPGLLYLSTISFLSEKERPASLQSERQHTFYSEILHAHETAHQWWGNLVTAATYHDEWLMEAFANYSALLILERKKGPKALETTLDEYKAEMRMISGTGKSAIPVESTGPITWGMRMRTDAPLDPWRIIVYNKGSWILHMLRRRMGDTNFLAMLGAIRKRYAYQPFNTDQFRVIAAEFSPKGIPDSTLDNFFDNWVYSTGVPTLEFGSSVKGKAPQVQVSVSVRQTGVTDEFSIDVPVEIRVPGQAQPIVKWVRTGPDPATFTLKLKAAPTKVELAPGAGVLAFRK